MIKEKKSIENIHNLVLFVLSFVINIAIIICFIIIHLDPHVVKGFPFEVIPAVISLILTSFYWLIKKKWFFYVSISPSLSLAVGMLFLGLWVNWFYWPTDIEFATLVVFYGMPIMFLFYIVSLSIIIAKENNHAK